MIGLEHLDPNRIYYRWDGRQKSNEGIFVLLHWFYLSVLDCDNTGTRWRFRRLYGYRAMHGDDDRTRVRFGVHPVMRIEVSRDRKGFLRPQFMLHEGEKAVPADAEIAVVPGQQPRFPWVKGRVTMIEFMSPQQLAAAPERLVLPDLCLVQNKDASRMPDLRLSPDPDSLARLTLHPGYRPHESPSVNAKRMCLDFAARDSCGRLGFPFSMFDGQGVLAANQETTEFGCWFCLGDIRQVRLPHLWINFKNYEKDTPDAASLH